MSAETCGAGYDNCDCDLVDDRTADMLGVPHGYIISGCECHDCNRCGEIECDCA